MFKVACFLAVQHSVICFLFMMVERYRCLMCSVDCVICCLAYIQAFRLLRHAVPQDMGCKYTTVVYTHGEHCVKFIVL